MEGEIFRPSFAEVDPGVSKVFKEYDFGLRVEGEVYPKALTFPVDNLLLKRELVAVNKTKPFLPTHQRNHYLFTCLKRLGGLRLRKLLPSTGVHNAVP